MRISDVDISLLVNNKQAILCNLRYLGLTFFYESKFPFDVHVEGADYDYVWTKEVEAKFTKKRIEEE